MKTFEHHGMTLWFGSEDAPAPEDTVSDGAGVMIMIGVRPADPGNAVEVRFSVNAGPAEVVPGRWARNDPSTKSQYFRATLPALRVGDVVAYTAVCRCAGRRVPAYDNTPLSEASFRVAPEPTVAVMEPRVVSLPAAPSASTSPEQPVAPVRSVVPPRPVTPRPAAPVGALVELPALARMERGQELLAALGRHGIRTLDDLRAAGGLGHVRDLPVAVDHPTAQILDAHVHLSILSRDAGVNAALIQRGFTRIDSIADMPERAFLNSTNGAVDESVAQGIHVTAGATRAVLDNALLDLATNPASPGFEIGEGIRDALDELFHTRCRCQHCEAAVSPLAYLADLLDYTIDHVQNGGGNVDLAFLTGTLHQPFGDLPAECREADRTVSQVRLCVEVLRRYLAAHQNESWVRARAPALRQAEQAYRADAYVTLLNRIGASYDELRLARAAGDSERRALADRLGIDLGSGRPDTLDALLLDPQAAPTSPGAITERRIEELFGLVDTTRNPLAPDPTPLLETWRLTHLRTLWLAQDWPEDTPGRGLPVIDPDVIGPDDFRASVAKAGPAAPDRAFDIWLRRRAWIDDRIDELRALRTVIGGANVPDFAACLRLTWPSVAIADLEPLLDDLTNAVDMRSAAAARGRVETDLSLSVESFRRLMRLGARDEPAASDVESAPVTDEEWEEVHSILVQARKTREFPTWVSEERRAGILLGPSEFWISLREPVEGSWPPRTGSRPLIDPETVAHTDLPEPTAGGRASQLWAARDARLGEIHRDLRAARRAGGFAAMLTRALGAAPPHDLDELSRALDDQDPAVAARAEVTIVTDLHLPIDAFRRLMSVRARSVTPGARRPLATEWADAYATLTTARKEIEEFPRWVREEQDPATGVVYWSALKARLPRWRAARHARGEWQQALRRRSALPLIDPDVIGPADLRNPVSGDPTFDLWSARQLWTASVLMPRSWLSRRSSIGAGAGVPGLAGPRAAAAVPQPSGGGVDWLERQAVSTLGVPASHLEELADRSERGENPSARLAQLSLTYGEFSALVRTLRLARQSPAAVLDSEWQDAELVFVQAAKRRRYAEWRDEEKLTRIVLGPDHFRLPDHEPPPLRRDARDLWGARRAWQEALRSRLGQVQAAVDALHDAVREAEQRVLPALRDALVAVAAPEAVPDRRAKWVTDHLMIDAEAGGCEATTRVAQAIESLQLLVWSIRTGQLKDTYPDLTLSAPRYDEEWPWIGSYASWRAAMFVFLYPENILLPSFRGEDVQTEGFREFLAEIDNEAAVTPDSAAKAAKIYNQYYRAVTALQIEASCLAEVTVDGASRVLTFFFARSTLTSACYWSRFDPQGPPRYSQSRWEPIEQLDGALKILAAVPFRDPNSHPFILVFVTLPSAGASKLIIARYDLQTPGWVTPHVEPVISLPAFSAVVSQQQTSEPPVVVFRDDSGAVFDKRLNLSGTDWESAVWDQPAGSAPYALMASVPVLPGQATPFYLFGRDNSGGLWFTVVGDGSHPHWEPLAGEFSEATGWSTRPENTGTWIGALRWRSEDQVFAWWLSESDGQVRVATLGGALGWEAKTWPSEFDDWLRHLTGRSVRDVSFEEVADASIIIAHGRPNETQTLEAFVADLVALGSAGWRRNLYTFLFETPVMIARASAGDRILAARTRNSQQAAIDRVRERIQSPTHDGWVAWQRADAQVRANTDGHLGIANSLFRFLPPGPAAAAGRLQGLTVRPLRRGRYDVSPDLSQLLAGGAQLPQLAVHSGSSGPGDPLLAYKDNQSDWMRGSLSLDAAAGRAPVGAIARIAPRDDGAPPLERITPGSGDPARRSRTQALIDENLGVSLPNLVYFEEYYYFVPVQLAIELQRRGYYEAALTWYRTVYDYTLPEADRKLWSGLVSEERFASSHARSGDWLADPLDPHRIAVTRRSAYTRFTILSLVRSFLDYADAEFTRDTAESLPRARTLYATALDLLAAGPLAEIPNDCEALIIDLENPITEPAWLPLWEDLRDELSRIGDRAALGATIDRIKSNLKGGGRVDARFATARAQVAGARAGAASRTVSALLERRSDQIANTRSMVLGLAGPASVGALPGPALPHNGAGRGHVDVLVPPFGSLRRLARFCVPPNPIVRMLRQHADLNLEKLRNCRNIAGLERPRELYAAPTDPESGVPTLDTFVVAEAAGAIVPQATQYRYRTLVERAKQVVQLAAQVESAMLSALQQRDVEAFQLLQARQGVALARARVRLRDLLVQEAAGSVELARLQQANAQLHVSHFDQLLAEGLSGKESASLALLGSAAALYTAAASVSWFSFLGDPSGGAAQSLRDTAQAAQASSSLLSRVGELRTPGGGVARPAGLRAAGGPGRHGAGRDRAGTPARGRTGARRRSAPGGLRERHHRFSDE